MTKHILDYNETSHHNLEHHFQSVLTIFNETLTEFEKLKVDTKLSFEDLKRGNFIEIFSEYHQNKHLKFYKDFQYNKYIEFCGLDTTRLQELENRYKVLLNGKFDFYKYNNSFYSYCEHRTRDLLFAEIMKNAPIINTYTMFDFVKISKSKITVDVPKGLFTLQTTSKKQVQLIADIKKYVEISKNLNIDYKLVKDAVSKYVKNISTDLTSIEWNYNLILTVQ